MNRAQIYLLNAGIDDVVVSGGDDPDPENWKYLSDVMGEYHLSAVLTSKSSGQEKPVIATCSKCGLEHSSHMAAANCCR